MDYYYGLLLSNEVEMHWMLIIGYLLLKEVGDC